MRLIVAFNPTELSVQIDEQGHVIEPHTWGVADADYVAEQLRVGGSLYEVDSSGWTEGDHAPAAIMAKKELEERLRLMKPPPPKPAPPVAAEEEAPPATSEVKE